MVQYVKERAPPFFETKSQRTHIIVWSYSKALTLQQNCPAANQTIDVSFHVPK